MASGAGRVGFGFHPSKKTQASIAFASSLFVFIALLAMIFSEDKPFLDLLFQKPAWFFAAGLFLLFTIALFVQLNHVLRTRFILEFGDEAVIDRRRVIARIIPYEAIEIFSPEPEQLFRVEPSLAEVREKVGLGEFISVSARLDDKHPIGADSDFTFFEKVQMPTYEMQQQIVSKIHSKLSNFARLVEDQGDDDADFDNTHA